MKNLIRITDYTADEIYGIFKSADRLAMGEHTALLKGKSVVMFFPETSIRTRVTFEKGVYLLGGNPILFPVESLEKKEALQDVCGYLNNWADLLVVRYKDIGLIEKLAEYSEVPVINAMTDVNHPCEIISDMYSLSKIRADFTKDKYLFCGRCGNIGLAWKEAADVMGFELEQCCPSGFEIEGVKVHRDIRAAVQGKDIVCTDSLPQSVLPQFAEYRVTAEIMSLANKGALLNLCPPFFRGEEVSEDAISSKYFVGYEFKKNLLYVQQAIMLDCLSD